MELKILVLLLTVGAILASGCIQQPESDINNLTIGASKTQQFENLKPGFSSYYEIERENISLNAPSYPLPLESTKIENYESNLPSI